jgi:hypothetical protein
MRLIQFMVSHMGRRVGLIEEDTVFDLSSFKSDWNSVYKIFLEALQSRKNLEEYIYNSDFRKNPVTFDYNELLTHRPGGKMWLLLPLDHPDPAHCTVTGTGLTHLGSASQRNTMHKMTDNPSNGRETDESRQKTDSQKMFEIGLEGGKPESGHRGIQPEWFYKGTGSILKGHNDFLDIPSFSEDCGEEPEIVGCYIVGSNHVPYRLGFTIGNEWSDHILERGNYLWLAASKLRACSIGPELITNQSFMDIRGHCRIYRGSKIIYDSGELLTGEDNMSHSLANLEDHHFKFPQFRSPGDVHIHFFGTMKLSSGNRSVFQNDDKIQIHFEGMGAELVNYVRRIPFDTIPVTVQKG